MSTTKWRGLGNETDFLALQKKFLKHLKEEERNEAREKQRETSTNYTFHQAPRAISSNADQPAQATTPTNRLRASKRAGVKPFQTVAETLEQSRQSRILDMHQKRQQHWNSLTSHLSQKLSQKPHNLLLHRSEREYRQKIEEVELMEAAKELRAQDKSKTEMTSPFAWQMSLRDADEMMVQVGGNYPYPLFVPVRKKRGIASKRRQQVIRKMTLKEELGVDHEENDELGQTVTESILGVRTMENAYATKRYKKELKKVLTNHDPVEFVGGLRVKGVNLSMRASRTVEDDEEIHEDEDDNARFSSEDEPEDIQPEHIDPDTPPRSSQQQRKPEVNGPAYRIQDTQLAFNTEPGQISYASITVLNVGTCALQYQWRKVAPVTALQKERAGSKFQLTSAARGILAPCTETEFYFSFKSPEEGIFSTDYEFFTTPTYTKEPSVVVQLRGTTIAPRDDIRFEQGFAQHFQHEVLRLQMENAVNLLIDALPEPDAPPSDAEERERRRRALLQKKFKEQNPTLQYVTDEIVEAFNQFSAHVIQIMLHPEEHIQREEEGEEEAPADEPAIQTVAPVDLKNTTWDFSIASLRQFIQQCPVDEETKVDLVSVLQDLLRATQPIAAPSEHNKASTPILRNESCVASLQSRLRYFALHKAILEGVDEMCEASNFVQLRYTEDPKAKGGKAKAAPKKGAAGGVTLEEEDEETKQRRLQDTKQRQVRAQARDALLNAIDAAVESFTESEEQISAFC